MTPNPGGSWSPPADWGFEGFGAGISISETPTVLRVVNLLPSGTGSFADMLDKHDGTPTAIVFDVGGYITMPSTSLQITKPNLYIFGDTAPSPGITFRMEEGTYIGALMDITGTAHDILIRNIRFRRGGDVDTPSTRGGWNLKIQRGYNIMIDHCSLSWSADNQLGIWAFDAGVTLENITVQYCLFAESFANHPTGANLGGETDISGWDILDNVSFHHNVLATIGHRLPRTSVNSEMMNNIIYNWNSQAGEVHRDAVADWVKNLYREGPIHQSAPIASVPGDKMFELKPDDLADPDASIHSDGNVLDGYSLNTTESDYNFWKVNKELVGGSTYYVLDELYKRGTRITQPATPITVDDVADLMTNLLPVVGAILPKRDSVDTRIINDVINRTGPSSSPADMDAVGGWPNVENL